MCGRITSQWAVGMDRSRWVRLQSGDSHVIEVQNCSRQWPVECFTPASQASVGGVMVSIVAFQAIDPGSIPGQRSFFLFAYDEHTIDSP